MRVPTALSDAFGAEFEAFLGSFLLAQGYECELGSVRYLRRSIVPHVRKLSEHFNRKSLAEGADALGLARYWKESSNPANLRLAYLLGFMPPNLMRMAAVRAELGRLGFCPEPGARRLLEVGAGPASGASGWLAAERYGEGGASAIDQITLLDSDRAVVTLGAEWLRAWSQHLGRAMSVRVEHERMEFGPSTHPSRTRHAARSASPPRADVWLSSYVLNEQAHSAAEIAQSLLACWEERLERDALIVLVEPALKEQSRRLLELRRELLARSPRPSEGPTARSNKREGSRLRGTPLQVLLPCLGEQSCGALTEPTDWCHEEAGWWRPPYLRLLDQEVGLDRKRLPFSYLVLARGDRTREQWLPALAAVTRTPRYRLVSPARELPGKTEFYVCGPSGKHRARLPKRRASVELSADGLERGDLIEESQFVRDSDAAALE